MARRHRGWRGEVGPAGYTKGAYRQHAASSPVHLRPAALDSTHGLSGAAALCGAARRRAVHPHLAKRSGSVKKRANSSNEEPHARPFGVDSPPRMQGGLSTNIRAGDRAGGGCGERREPEKYPPPFESLRSTLRPFPPARAHLLPARRTSNGAPPASSTPSNKYPAPRPSTC